MIELKEMSENEVRAVALMLKEKGVSLPCNRCNGLKFTVSGRCYLYQGGEVKGDEEIKTYFNAIAITCENCGNMNLHSSSSLGVR